MATAQPPKKEGAVSHAIKIVADKADDIGNLVYACEDALGGVLSLGASNPCEIGNVPKDKPVCEYVGRLENIGGKLDEIRLGLESILKRLEV